MATPIELVGYWASEDDLEWPDPGDFVDPSWDVHERSLVAGYLERGRTFRAAGGWSTCRLCDRRNGSSEKQDGMYYWPEGLAHYVTDHAVRLPDRFVRHVLATMASSHPDEPSNAETMGPSDIELAEDWWQRQTSYSPEAEPT
ncbi:MAG TPA: hypothetical protein VNQ33_07470 [Acidimicrobiales bacterium]|nr:hypothetical protein [Acidimicrobiales bacterium]